MISSTHKDKQKAPAVAGKRSADCGYLKTIPDDITGSNTWETNRETYDSCPLDRPTTGGIIGGPQWFQPDWRRRHRILDLVRAVPSCQSPALSFPVLSRLFHFEFPPCSGAPRTAIDRRFALSQPFLERELIGVAWVFSIGAPFACS